MLHRPVRGSLAESMRVVVEIPPTRAALIEVLRSEEGEDFPFAPGAVEVKAYGYDPRIEWHTWVVTINGMAAGYTNEGLVDG
jgi:hypothetical protein